MTRNLTGTEIIARHGGEVKNTPQGPVTRNTQANFSQADLGSQYSSITEYNSTRGYPGIRFDLAVAFFERKGVPRSIARAYGISLLETARATGKDITEIVGTGETGKHVLNDEALARANFARPKTSQIGYKVPNDDSIENKFIQRSILP